MTPRGVLLNACEASKGLEDICEGGVEGGLVVGEGSAAREEKIFLLDAGNPFTLSYDEYKGESWHCANIRSNVSSRDIGKMPRTVNDDPCDLKKW